MEKKKEFQIQVTARIKPCTQKDQNCESVLAEQCRKLHFKNILDSETLQSQVFNNQVQPLLDSFIKGYNCTILAYGQTGSGKTHTIFGPPNCIHQYKQQQQQEQEQLQEQQQKQTFISQTPQDWGVFPRSMNYLLEILEKQKTQGDIKNVTIKLTAVEIYLEQIYDLLDNSKRIAISSTERGQYSQNGLLANLKNVNHNAKGQWISPFEAKKNYEKNFEVKGSKERDIKGLDDVVDFTKLVESVRISKGHDINARSSRSHCVITINLQYQSNKKVIKSKFLFIDLAGSERLSRSGVTGQKKKESTATNLSLTQLGRCINAISKKEFVPYRDSTLTMMIKDSFNGNTRTGLFITLSSDLQYMDESVISLQFGQRSAKISTKVSVNSRQSVNVVQMKKQVENELSKVKKELKELDDKGMGGGIDQSAGQHLQEAFLYNQKQLEANKAKMIKIKQSISEMKCNGQEDTKEFQAFVQEKKYIDAEIEKFEGMVMRQMTTGIYTAPSNSYVNKERKIQALQQEMEQLNAVEEDI